jgi:hypothetical protein
LTKYLIKKPNQCGNHYIDRFLLQIVFRGISDDDVEVTSCGEEVEQLP